MKKQRGPARPKVAGEPQFVRLTDDLLRRVEAHRLAMEKRGEGSTKSDAMRDLIRRGLETVRQAADADEGDGGRVALADNWRVERYGGRSTDRWRTIFGGCEASARKAYVVARAKMRRGGLQLMRPDGSKAAEARR